MVVPAGSRMIAWAGGILAVVGAGHLLLGLVFSVDYFDEWLTFQLWGRWLEDTPEVNGFWGVPGGFGLPLAIVGALVLWMNSNGIVPPAFLAWTVLAWGAVCAIIVEPTPAPLLVVAALLLLRGIRSAASEAEVAVS
ncbi:DUF6463 family protein [Nocardia rhizosphaerae]|uniref:DUF6463 family protein n=1 Tax=Nocardia rhizosphaerae TaxID=1691571 RepID=A0ABV8L1C7_9NOCA